MAQHRFPTLVVELGDTEGFDVLFAAETQFSLHGEFDREPVAVPTGATRYVVALHRAVARENVLEDPRLDVMSSWHTVGCGRSLVEHPLRLASSLFQTLVEDVVVLPELQNPRLHVGGAFNAGSNLAVHRPSVL